MYNPNLSPYHWRNQVQGTQATPKQTALIRKIYKDHGITGDDNIQPWIAKILKADAEQLPPLDELSVNICAKIITILLEAQKIKAARQRRQELHEYQSDLD